MLPDRVSNPGPLTYESGACTGACTLDFPHCSQVKIVLLFFFKSKKIITHELKLCEELFRLVTKTS